MRRSSQDLLFLTSRLCISSEFAMVGGCQSSDLHFGQVNKIDLSLFRSAKKQTCLIFWQPHTDFIRLRTGVLGCLQVSLNRSSRRLRSVTNLTKGGRSHRLSPGQLKNTFLWLPKIVKFYIKFCIFSKIKIQIRQSGLNLFGRNLT